MTDAEKNGMTEAEWKALPEAERARRMKAPAPKAAATPVAPAGRPAVDDRPGKEPEAAAPSGAEPKATPGVSPPGQGAQVILTGDAQAAARGGTHGDIVSNTAARDEAIEAGHVAKGTTAEAADNAKTGGMPADDDDDNNTARTRARPDAARTPRR